MPYDVVIPLVGEVGGMGAPQVQDTLPQDEDVIKHDDGIHLTPEGRDCPRDPRGSQRPSSGRKSSSSICATGHGQTSGKVARGKPVSRMARRRPRG